MPLKIIISSILLLTILCSNNNYITIYIEPSPEVNTWEVFIAVKPENTSHDIQFVYLDNNNTKDTIICKAIFKSSKYRKFKCIAPNLNKELNYNKIKEIQVKETQI